jgi:hypothetical protein
MQNSHTAKQAENTLKKLPFHNYLNLHPSLWGPIPAEILLTQEERKKNKHQQKVRPDKIAPSEDPHFQELHELLSSWNMATIDLGCHFEGWQEQ